MLRTGLATLFSLALVMSLGCDTNADPDRVNTNGAGAPPVVVDRGTVDTTSAPASGTKMNDAKPKSNRGSDSQIPTASNTPDVKRTGGSDE